AGFIGSSMADRLLLGPHNLVTIFDNFSWGHSDFLPRDNAGGRLKVISNDLLELDAVKEGMAGNDIVYQFASNADIAGGHRIRALMSGKASSPHTTFSRLCGTPASRKSSSRPGRGFTATSAIKPLMRITGPCCLYPCPEPESLARRH